VTIYDWFTGEGYGKRKRNYSSYYSVQSDMTALGTDKSASIISEVESKLTFHVKKF
jgi:hypothetical protein